MGTTGVLLIGGLLVLLIAFLLRESFLPKKQKSNKSKISKKEQKIEPVKFSYGIKHGFVHHRRIYQSRSYENVDEDDFVDFSNLGKDLSTPMDTPMDIDLGDDEEDDIEKLMDQAQQAQNPSPLETTKLDENDREQTIEKSFLDLETEEFDEQEDDSKVKYVIVDTRVKQNAVPFSKLKNENEKTQKPDNKEYRKNLDDYKKEITSISTQLLHIFHKFVPKDEKDEKVIKELLEKYKSEVFTEFFEIVEMNRDLFSNFFTDENEKSVENEDENLEDKSSFTQNENVVEGLSTVEKKFISDITEDWQQSEIELGTLSEEQIENANNCLKTPEFYNVVCEKTEKSKDVLAEIIARQENVTKEEVKDVIRIHQTKIDSKEEDDTASSSGEEIIKKVEDQTAENEDRTASKLSSKDINPTNLIE